MKEEARGSQHDCPMGSMSCGMLVSRGGSSLGTMALDHYMVDFQISPHLLSVSATAKASTMLTT